MIRLAFLPVALVAATPALANYYRARPVTQPDQAQFVARENVWRCAGTDCSSPRTATRPAIVCATLVREVGALSGFSVEGRAFTADELENCNRRAR